MYQHEMCKNNSFTGKIELRNFFCSLIVVHLRLERKKIRRAKKKYFALQMKWENEKHTFKK